jgi:hypothetical protein
LGALREPYDLLLVLRLNADYAPLEAIQVPRQVVQEYQHDGRLNWTKRLTRDLRVRTSPETTSKPPHNRKPEVASS